MAGTEPLRVLIAMREPAAVEALRAILRQHPTRVTSVDDLVAARAAAATVAPSLVFLDAACLDVDGDDGLHDLRSLLPEPALIVALADGSAASASALLSAGVDAALRTPAGGADVARVLALVEALTLWPDAVHRERFRRMSAIQQLGLDVLALPASDARLTALLETGCRALRARALAICTVVEADDRLAVRASVGVSDAYIRHLEERSVGHGRAQLDEFAHHTFRRVRLSPASPAPGRLVDPEIAEAAGLRFLTLLPIRDPGTVHGLLAVYHADEAHDHAADLPLAESLATTIAATLSVTQLERELSITERLYRGLVDRLPLGVVVCDLNGRIEVANAAFGAMTGHPAALLAGTPLANLFLNPGDIPWQDWLDDTGEGRCAAVLHLRGAAGRRLVTSCRGGTLRLPGAADAATDGQPRIQVTIDDITVEHRRLHELQLLHDLTQLVALQGSIEVAFRTVADRLVQELGYRIVGLATLTPDRQHLEGRSFVGEYQRDLARWSVDVGLTGRAVRENRSLLVRDVHAEPDYLPVHAEVTSEIVAVVRIAGVPVGALDIESDAANPLDEDDLALAESIAVHLGLLLDQLEETERLSQQARTDPATGAANRRALIERLRSLPFTAAPGKTAVLLIDFDRFKAVNDRYGHLSGDAVLTQVVRRLASNLRPSDLLSRYAGDELAVVLGNLTPEQALEIAERLRRSIVARPFEHAGHRIALSVSIGVAFYPDHGETPEELLAAADRAMYVAKGVGGNAVHGAATGS